LITDKKVSGKSKDEQMAEKKQELEKRLQDVTGQLGSGVKKTAKKGKKVFYFWFFEIYTSTLMSTTNLYEIKHHLHQFLN
jgi:hypothetical protein